MSTPVVVYYMDNFTGATQTLNTDTDHISFDVSGLSISFDPVPPNVSGDRYFQPWSRITRLFYPGHQ